MAWEFLREDPRKTPGLFHVAYVKLFLLQMIFLRCIGGHTG